MNYGICEKNMVIMSGYCVAGTVGHKILNGAKKVEMENRQLSSEYKRLWNIKYSL